MKNKLIFIVFVVFLILGPYFAKAYEESVFVFERDVEVLDFGYNLKEKEVMFSFEETNIDSKNKVLSVNIDPNDNSINAISLKIKYSKENLKPIIVDNTNSAFSLFFVEYIDEESGIITITYIEPFPGVNNKSKVVDILFEKNNEKVSYFSLGNDSEVLANDGLGTHLLWSIK